MIMLAAGFSGSRGFGSRGHAGGREEGALAEPASLGRRMRIWLGFWQARHLW